MLPRRGSPGPVSMVSTESTVISILIAVWFLTPYETSLQTSFQDYLLGGNYRTKADPWLRTAEAISTHLCLQPAGWSKSPEQANRETGAVSHPWLPFQPEHSFHGLASWFPKSEKSISYPDEPKLQQRGLLHMNKIWSLTSRRNNIGNPERLRWVEF